MAIDTGPGLSVASYGNLLDTIRPHTEEHRAYVVLKFPQSDAFDTSRS
ncbi:hypothetical protein [Rhodococcus sp. P1Y]|nr:hypothetical protein [Rhodococcus sp. P1Y]